jgi:hypothetical protein
LRRGESDADTRNAQRLGSGLVAQGDGSGAEVAAADEVEVDGVCKAGEDCGAVAGQTGMDDEFVLVDQAQFGQGARERYAAGEEGFARLLFEVADGLGQIASEEFGVPIGVGEGAGDDVLLGGVDGAGEGMHPRGHGFYGRGWAEGGFHHLVGDAAEEEGAGLFDVFDGVAVELFVGEDGEMVAAAVEGDVDGVPEGAHAIRVAPAGWGAACWIQAR